MPIAYFHIVFVHHTRGAGREAEAAFADHDRLGEIRRRVGDVVVEPERAVRVVGEIGDNVAAANLDQAILHELGFDEKIIVNVLEFRHQRAADEPVKICPGYQSHDRITSSTGVQGRLKAFATPSYVILPPYVLSPFASALFRMSACGKPRLASSSPYESVEFVNA